MDNANVVNLQYRVKKAFEGKYFIGHTPFIPISPDTESWAGLLNPAGSNIDLFLCTFTVSNYHDSPLQAMMWLADAPEFGSVSPSVAASNLGAFPPPRPRVKLVYAAEKKCPIRDGVSIFPRIIAPYSTEVGNYYGKIVVPPDHAVIIQLNAVGKPQGVAEAAFGWWEEHRCS